MLWKKPSGIEIETNDMKETIAYCKSLGWEQIGGTEPKPEAQKEPEAPKEMEAPAKSGKIKNL